ncbi:MFS transporter [Thermovenabulum gondwanense]|mgnify:CR=1 FL=1|uniref:Melibiose carrier protein n=1 Tax=Thermovenabulum gondwanense TaxID=520767 RepID=A0A161PVP1_9FIRM|nr:MFS transporter [Thermovenabulum gondwanense]KYO64633.1 Melibiose carrier protein [Thermovenabulum gondwanense]
MKKPLSKALRTFYGLGDFGFSLMTSVELYLFVFFLTNVAKFSLPMVALIGSVTSIVDAILSPFYGAIISGMKPLKWGRNRSWMLIAPPFVVILYIFQFTKIGPESLAAFIVCAGFILSHIAWNIPWVANVSLIPVLANNPEERALLASRRATYTALAGVVFSYTGPPLANYLGKVTNNPILGYSMLAGIMAFVMMICYWTVFKLTEGYEPTEQVQGKAASSAQRVSFKGMLNSLVQNPPLIVLLMSDFLRYMVNFIMTAAAAYYFTYVAQNMSLLPMYLLLGSIAQVIGAYIAGPLAKSLSTRTASIVGLFGLGIALILCKFVAMNLVMFFVVVLIARAFLGLLASVMVSLYSDVSIFAQWKTGEDASPFVMGLMNLSLKTAIISRGTIIPFVLSTAGFVSGIKPQEATMALKNAVVNVFVFIPGVFALVSGIILAVGYKLTREKLVEMQNEINQRKAEASGAIK